MAVAEDFCGLLLMCCSSWCSLCRCSTLRREYPVCPLLIVAGRRRHSFPVSGELW